MSPRTIRSRARLPLIVLGVGLALLVAVLLAARPGSAGTQGGGDGETPPPEALKHLKEMEDEIRRAKGGDRSDSRHLFFAHEDKLKFIKAVFPEDDCGRRLIVRLLELDEELAAAGVEERGGFERDRNLRDAINAAGGVDDELKDCGTSDQRKFAERNLESTQRLLRAQQRDELNRNELESEARDVRVRKLTIVDEQPRIFGCKALKIFTILDQLDVAFVLAGSSDEHREVREILGRALEDTERLIKIWKKVPCGGQTPTEPVSIQNQLASNHPNGFGNPPSFECNRAKISPAQAGVQVTDQITRPDASTVTKQATTDAGGVATISSAIAEPGTYTHTTTATVNGQTVSDTDSHTVASQNNGSCPAQTP